jgi:hypothetical protein
MLRKFILIALFMLQAGLAAAAGDPGDTKGGSKGGGKEGAGSGGGTKGGGCSIAAENCRPSN